MFSDHKVSTKFSLKGKTGQRSKASTRGFRFQTTYISDHFKLDTRRLLVQCLASLTEYVIQTMSTNHYPLPPQKKINKKNKKNKVFSIY